MRAEEALARGSAQALVRASVQERAQVSSLGLVAVKGKGEMEVLCLAGLQG